MIEQLDFKTKHFNELQAVFGEEHIHKNIESTFDFIQIATKGINANIIKNFRDYFGLSLNQTAKMLDVSEPSIYRWSKSNKKLDRNVAVKLFEISELFFFGIEVFGNKDNFYKWLDLPNIALGGIQPRELIDIPEGITKVKDLIGRIEYGIFS